LLSVGAGGWAGPAGGGAAEIGHLPGSFAAHGHPVMFHLDAGHHLSRNMSFTGKSLSPQLKAEFQKLQTDTQAIQAKSQVTPAETTALRDDFKAINKAATSPPSPTAVQTFQNDLKSLQGTLPTDAQRAQLESDFKAVVNSRGVTDQTLIDKTISDAEAIVASSNITSADLATIAADQKAIQTDLGLSNPKGLKVGPMGGAVGDPGLAILLAGSAGEMPGHFGKGGMPGMGMMPGDGLLPGGPKWAGIGRMGGA
jgi:hypothetical protein